MVATIRVSGHDEENSPTKTALTLEMSWPGLEPGTYGLTYRTGFHPPRRCGLDFTIFPREAARQVSEEPLAGFLLIAQSGGLSRSRVPTALRVFQHMVRFYLRPSGRGTPIEVRCSTD